MGDDPTRRRRRYRYTDWRADGFRGPPPWRRSFRPGYFLLIGLVSTIVLVIVVLAASR